MKALLTFLLSLLLAITGSSQASGAPNAPTAQPETAEVVYVLGEIRVPQALPFTPGLNLDGAIGNAGGVANLGATRVTVIRMGSVIVRSSMNRLADSTDNIMLAPGDVIYLGPVYLPRVNSASLRLRESSGMFPKTLANWNTQAVSAFGLTVPPLN